MLPCDAAEPVLACRDLSVWAGPRRVLDRIDLEVHRGEVLCLTGPSGAGKTTLLRCFNRLVDLTPGLSVHGRVLFHGGDVYRRALDVDAFRVRVGMLFQQPVVFPGSIGDNVLFGARRLLRLERSERRRRLEQALGAAALWEEVKDRLGDDALTLSVGQQQRLCLARTLALEPEVVLMDEPTSALDPASTRAIEGLIVGLKDRCTVVLVTHQREQALAVGDRIARLAVRDGAGVLAEVLPVPGRGLSSRSTPAAPASLERIHA
jgi:phosphate transport system ATP-binding protein